MLQFGQYSAWISIDGKAAETYDIDRSNSTTSCWIASEAGKNFSVNWYNAGREIALQAVISIDGLVCDHHIMLDALRYPNKPCGVGVSYARTSDYTRRDFVFSPIQVTDDDAYLDTIDATTNIGTITLELWRLHVSGVTTQLLEHSYGGPVLESQVVHERSKKAGAHHVKFGEEYASPAPSVDIVQGFLLDQAPYLTFTFKYRPYAFLMANDIVPRPVTAIPVPRQLTSANNDTTKEIRRLEERIKALRSNRQPYKSQRSKASARVKAEPRDEIIDLTNDA